MRLRVAFIVRKGVSNLKGGGKRGHDIPCQWIACRIPAQPEESIGQRDRRILSAGDGVYLDSSSISTPKPSAVPKKSEKNESTPTRSAGDASSDQTT